MESALFFRLTVAHFVFCVIYNNHSFENQPQIACVCLVQMLGFKAVKLLASCLAVALL